MKLLSVALFILLAAMVLASKKHADPNNAPTLAFTFDTKEEEKGALASITKFFSSFRKDPVVEDIQKELDTHAEEDDFDLDAALNDSPSVDKVLGAGDTKEPSAFEAFKNFFASSKKPVEATYKDNLADHAAKDEAPTAPSTETSLFDLLPKGNPFSKPPKPRTLEDIMEESIGDDSSSDYDPEEDVFDLATTDDEYLFPPIDLLYDHEGKYVGDLSIDDKHPDSCESYSSGSESTDDESNNEKSQPSAEMNVIPQLPESRNVSNEKSHVSIHPPLEDIGKDPATEISEQNMDQSPELPNNNNNGVTETIHQNDISNTPSSSRDDGMKDDNTEQPISTPIEADISHTPVISPSDSTGSLPADNSPQFPSSADIETSPMANTNSDSQAGLVTPTSVSQHQEEKQEQSQHQEEIKQEQSQHKEQEQSQHQEEVKQEQDRSSSASVDGGECSALTQNGELMSDHKLTTKSKLKNGKTTNRTAFILAAFLVAVCLAVTAFLGFVKYRNLQSNSLIPPFQSQAA